MPDLEVRTYRSLVLWGSFVPPRRRDWRALQRAIGFPLSDEYRAFMDVANGATLPYSVALPPGGDGEPIEFSQLNRVTPAPEGIDAWGTVLGEHRAMAGAADPGPVPADAVPVAADQGGSRLFLCASGEVRALVHGLPSWAGGDGRDTGGLVAPSWDGFLDLLFIEEETAEEDWRDSAGLPEWRAIVARLLDAGLPGWRHRPWAADA